MTFAERLKQLREQAGLTQESLARKSNLSLGAVRNYEQGIREPYWQIVFQLAEALGVSCEVFRDAVAPPTEQPSKAAGSPASERSGGKAAGKPARPKARPRKPKK